MNRVFSALAKQQLKLFKVTYNVEYKTLLPNHIIADRTHPLHEAQKRRLRERKKEGLWWFVTAGPDASKSSCVRTWARRRLRQAVLDELRLRGYDKNGLKIPQEQNLNMKGSLKLWVQAPLIPAQFETVKAEASKIVDIMVQAAEIEAGAKSPVGRIMSHLQSTPLQQPPGRKNVSHR